MTPVVGGTWGAPLRADCRPYIEVLRSGSAPEDLIDKLEAAYDEIDRLNAIATEIPGGRVEKRHRADEALGALMDAIDALDAYERWLRARMALPWYRRIFHRWRPT